MRTKDPTGAPFPSLFPRFPVAAGLVAMLRREEGSSSLVTTAPTLSALDRAARIFVETAGEGGVMTRKEEWAAFVEMMVEHGLVEEQEVSELRGLCDPSTENPLTFEGFSERLLASGSTELTRSIDGTLERSLAEIQRLLLLVRIWGVEELSAEETRNVLGLVEGINALHERNVAAVEAAEEELRMEAEDLRLKVLFWDHVNDTESESPLMTAHQYQRRNSDLVERRGWEVRIRDIYYRDAGSVPILSKEPSGARWTIAWSMGRQTSTEVEVLNIPRTTAHTELCAVYNQVDAMRQLVLSNYFHKYLGSNEVSHPDDLLFFFEHRCGDKLEDLMASHGPLHEASLLFRYWTREILLAFQDLLTKSTFQITNPITTKNILISDHGKRITLVNLKWGGDCPEADLPGEGAMYTLHRKFESSLLLHFRAVVFDLLCVRPPPSKGPDRTISASPRLPFLSPVLETILCCCVHVRRHATLAQVLRHPFFAPLAPEEHERIESTFVRRAGEGIWRTQ